MPANDFLEFAFGSSANMITQSSYEALAARESGFSAGTAQSDQLNRVWHQSAFGVAALMQAVGNRTGEDTLDDDDIDGAAGKILRAMFSAGGGQALLVATPQTVDADSNRNLYVVNGVSTLAFSIDDDPATLGTAWSVALFARDGKAVVSIPGGSSINGGSAGIGVTVPKGFVGTLYSLGVTAYAFTLAKIQPTVTTISANATLSPEQSGLVLVDTSGGNRVITMPAGALLAGLPFQLVKVSTDSNSASFAVSGSDTFVGGTPSLTMQGEGVSLVCDGASPNARWVQPSPSRKGAVAARLETRSANAVVTALTNALLLANAKIDDSGNYQRLNDAATAAGLRVKNDGTLKRLTAAAGSGNIAWTEEGLDIVIANQGTDLSVSGISYAYQRISGSAGADPSQSHGWFSCKATVSGTWSPGTKFTVNYPIAITPWIGSSGFFTGPFIVTKDSTDSLIAPGLSIVSASGSSAVLKVNAGSATGSFEVHLAFFV